MNVDHRRRARARRARPPGRGDPGGAGRRPGRADPVQPGRHGRGHGRHAGQARRDGPHRGRGRRGPDRRPAADAARAARRRHLAGGAPRRGADLGDRAADPPRRQPAGLPRPRRQRRPTAPTTRRGRDRRGRPPAPRRPGAHGRRGRGEDPVRRARATGVVTSADVLAPGEPGILEWIARRARPTSTTSCPTTSRCSASPARPTSRRAAARWSSAASGCVAATRGARGRAGGRPRTGTRSRPSTSRWSTPPAAATRSRPGTCAGWRWAARRRRRRALGCAAAAQVAAGPGLRPRRLRPRRRGRVRRAYPAAGGELSVPPHRVDWRSSEPGWPGLTAASALVAEGRERRRAGGPRPGGRTHPQPRPGRRQGGGGRRTVRRTDPGPRPRAGRQLDVKTFPAYTEGRGRLRPREHAKPATPATSLRTRSALADRRGEPGSHRPARP